MVEDLWSGSKKLSGSGEDSDVGVSRFIEISGGIHLLGSGGYSCSSGGIEDSSEKLNSYRHYEEVSRSQL